MPEAALVKTFRARSINEALSTVKRELGAEAVILSTRKLRRVWPGREPGLLEVRAAVPAPGRRSPGEGGDGPGARNSRQPTAGTGLDVRSLNNLQTAISRMYQQVCQSRIEKVAEQDALDKFVQGFRREVERATATLRSLVAEAHLLRSTGLPPAQVEVIRQLVDGGVEPGHAEAIVRSSPQDGEDVAQVRQAVARFLLRHLPVAESLQVARRRRVAAFIGPAGVGKTTTIAKIAAACLITGKRVGLVTTDTYRVGGTEQIRAYADCMRLPLEVAESPAQVRRALERMGERHLVLIDTAGVGPRQSRRWQAVTALVSRAWVDEIHLVLGAQTSFRELEAWRHLFGQPGPDRLVCTKLDDAAGYGMLFNGPVMLRARLSYLCTGQRVPEDLEVATPERVVRLLLSGNRRNGQGGR